VFNEGIDHALDQAREADDDVRVAGGGATILEHLNADLVDEFSITLSPVPFGVGTGLSMAWTRPGSRWIRSSDRRSRISKNSAPARCASCSLSTCGVPAYSWSPAIPPHRPPGSPRICRIPRSLRMSKVLYIIVCAAGPASGVGELVALAQNAHWTVQIIATPSALDFIDAPALETQTGRPVRSQYRKPTEPKSPRADAIIVAPCTYNTINKFAQGIADTYALGLLAEAPGLGIPVVILPFVNTALASRTVFRHNVDRLRAEGIHILIGTGQFEPHTPDSGAEHTDTYPWHLTLSALTPPKG
jgi:hypothetical protein